MEIEDSGVYEGLKSVTYFWNKVFDVNRMHGTPGFLAIHMTVNPLIELNRDHTKAKGLWHSHGVCSFGAGGEFKQFLALGKYDIEYVKEDGVWKIKKLHFNLTFRTPFEEGWLNVPVIGQHGPDLSIPPDEPPTAYFPYPSGYHVPFSFKHPITGK